MRVHLVFILKEKGRLLKPSDGRFTSSHGHTHLLTKGQFCAACGDVLQPKCLILVTLAAGVGEMDHPSVMTISLSAYRVSDLPLYFSLDSFMFWSVTEYLSIPTEQRHLFLLEINEE